MMRRASPTNPSEKQLDRECERLPSSLFCSSGRLETGGTRCFLLGGRSPLLDLGLAQLGGRPAW
jgi:hypothetical protein